MTSKYFTPVEFDDLKPEETPKPKEKIFNEEKLKPAIKEVWGEIKKLADGTSEYVRRGLYFKDNTSPAHNYLRIFEGDPTWKNFDNFYQLAKQEFSARPADAMRSILIKALEIDNG